MGDEADYMIEQMIWGNEVTYRPRRPILPKREATEVAEELLDAINEDKVVKKLNEDVIKW